ncbi:MAG TPA: hypothetical protein P5526_10760 [Anaerolineae bacterium]|nr:hypothetical protein [Anaerolineales bacterium]HRV92633.1 hypothetical protein [Anaerolineae bacterium]
MSKTKLFGLKTVIGLLGLIIILTFYGSGKEVNAAQVDVPPLKQQKQSPDPSEKVYTPLQQALKQTFAKRSRSGLPGPASVTYENDVAVTPKPQGIDGPPQEFIVTAKTVLEFDNPKQAGLDKWPDTIVADHPFTQGNGVIVPGDYSDNIKDFLAAELPGIWDQYEFGYEPRRYIFRETYKITYPAESAPKLPLPPITTADSSAIEEIVFGFTETGPRIDYTIDEEWEECFLGICVTLAEVKAGLALDWDIGLRLPVDVSMTSANPLVFNTSYQLSSTITPLDWTAAQFEQAGLEGANGNEFLLRYVVFLGVQAEIVGVEAIDWGIDAEFDGSASFTTPFGPGTSFPLPSLELSPAQTGLQWDIVPSILSVGIGLTINPSLSQGEITANWQAVPGSDAQGNGSLAYLDPPAKTTFGPVLAGDFGSTTQAHIRLDEFQYGFDQFLLELGGFLEIEVLSFDAEVADFDIVELELDDISDGPWLGVHPETNEAVDHWVEVAEIGPTTDGVIYLPLIRR